MTTTSKILFYSFLACTLLLAACQKRAAPRVTSAPAYHQKIGVVGFTQPTTTSQLIRGSLPEKQGRIAPDTLVALDRMLHTDLATTKRLYTFIPVNHVPNSTSYHESGRPQGLAYWTQFAEGQDIDLLLVPQIINWHQRQGSSAGVTEPAHVRAEFYLINVKTGQIVKFTTFEEKQAGLVDNMLGVGDFLKRKGAWVTAEELTQEAIRATIKELGL
ncbi:MAG: hypothetical protein RRY29_10155 [Desulfovibrionaceae bacterium]